VGSGGIAPPFLTSEVDGDEWSDTLERMFGGPQSRSGQINNNLNMRLINNRDEKLNKTKN
jgi:hypothetical protein